MRLTGHVGTLFKWANLGVLLVALGYMPAYAQRCSLAGTVADAQTKLPIAAAAVYIPAVADKTAFGAYADAEGHFFIEKLPCQDSVQVRVAMIGYATYVARFLPGQRTQLRILLAPAQHQTAEVEIRGLSLTVPASVTGQATATIDSKTLMQLQGQSLADQLATLPGVSVVHTGPTIAKPMVHGLYGNRVVILNNGVRLEGQNWGADHAPELDPYGSTRLQVLKGAASLRYGPDALAGVVRADAAPLPTGPGLQGQLQSAAVTNGRLGSLAARLQGGFLGKRAAGWGWRLQGSGRRGGNFSTPSYYLANTAFSEASATGAIGVDRPTYSLQAFGSYFSTQTGIFLGATAGTLPDVQAAIARGAPLYTPGFSYNIGRPYQQVSHALGKVQGHYHLTEHTSLEVQYAFQQNRRKEYDRLPLSRKTNPELDLTLSSHTLQAELHHHLLPGISGVAGVQAIAQRNTWEGQFFVPNYTTATAGFFCTERWSRGPWAAEAGLRADYKSINAYFSQGNPAVVVQKSRTFLQPSYALGAAYTKGLWRWALHAGSGWRAPSANELYSKGLHQSAASFEVGQASLAAERSHSLTLSGSVKKQKVWAEADLFVSYMPGFIYLSPNPDPIVTVRGAFPAFTHTQTNARMAGADITAGALLTPRLQLLHKSSWLRTQDPTTGTGLFFMPANRFEHMLRYQTGPDSAQWYAQVSVQTILRQGRAPAGRDYAPAPPAYTLLGAEVGTRLRGTGKNQFFVSLACTNLLNTVYRDYLNRFRYFAHDLGRAFALRLSYTF